MNNPKNVWIIYCILNLSVYLTFSEKLTANCAALWQLDGLSQCVIHQPYSKYQNYGCVCSNIHLETPVDNIDRCCAQHNECYDSLESTCSNPDAPLFCSYKWLCDSSQIICENGSNCLQDSCKCDKKLIDCLSQYPYPVISKGCPHSEKKNENHSKFNEH